MAESQLHPPHSHVHPSIHGDVEHLDEHHGPTVAVYLKVFAALMVLLVLTLAAAAVDLGPWNIWIAMTIAVVKAVLIVLFFMHVIYGTRLVKFFAAAALFWLMIMFSLTPTDYRSRGWLPNAREIIPAGSMYPQGTLPTAPSNAGETIPGSVPPPAGPTPAGIPSPTPPPSPGTGSPRTTTEGPGPGALPAEGSAGARSQPQAPRAGDTGKEGDSMQLR